MRLIIEVCEEGNFYAYRENEKQFKENEPKRREKLQLGTADMLSEQCYLNEYSGIYWTFKI